MSLHEDESALPENERVSNLHAVPFGKIVDRLERAEAPGDRIEKHARIFDESLKATIGRQSSYPLVSLMLGTRRHAGRLGETSLAKLYLRQTGLERARNEAALELRFFARDAEARGAFRGADLGDVVERVLTDRLERRRGDMTLGTRSRVVNMSRRRRGRATRPRATRRRVGR